MNENIACAECGTQNCKNGQDCFGVAADHADLYSQEGVTKLHRSAAAIEARHYCKETRLGEVILFAREMGFGKLGLAFCVGLASEAEITAKILSQDFQVVSVCCKVGGIAKSTFGLEQIDSTQEEVMCNPVGQAELLNQAATELNVLCGLCVGHDAIFSMRSDAPVTTLIAKDRVLAHNPAGAIYSPYLRRQFTIACQ